jgi:hypothetical protein
MNMLFVVDHKHSAETCPAGTVHPDKEFTNKLEDQIKTSGVRVVDGYLDGPGHRFYFVIEADTTQQILSFAVPMISVGETNIHSVLKWSDAIATSRKLGMQR